MTATRQPAHVPIRRRDIASFAVRLAPACAILAAALVLPLLDAQLLHAQTAANPQVLFDRAVGDFENGRIAESAAEFDRLASLAPTLAPQLWQRGIALYYAGRYADCRRQFESHRTVNPNDVENAAWHFLCVARAESPEEARAALLPVGPDARPPMTEVYQMLRGAVKPEDVIAAARRVPEDARPLAEFYAQLYAGLYLEALGKPDQSLEHIRIAAADRYSMGGYMHTVARIHQEVRTRRNSP